MAISNKMSILGTKKAVLAYNGGYYLPSVSEKGILSWTPTVEGMAPIPEVNVRGPQGSDASVTAEAVQAVVPMNWEKNLVYGRNTPSSFSGGIEIGLTAKSINNSGVSIGGNAQGGYNSVAIGIWSLAKDSYSTSLGFGATSETHSVAVGYGARTKKNTSVCVGANFSETVEGSTVTYTCASEGTGSITIGAGANTLNNGDTESSNSVTIGCKALNQGADSVVIGAQASGTQTSMHTAGGVTIGAGASNSGSAVVIGRTAKVPYGVGVAVGANSQTSSIACVSVGDTAKSSYYGTAIGHETETKDEGIALGAFAKALNTAAVAIGFGAKTADKGCVVIASYSEANFANWTRTQLYFSGANTPLANTYEDGEAMMGYVVTDKNGNVMVDAEGNAMVGTQKLSVLFPNNRGENAFTPAALNLDEGWTPKPMFRPSDLDMPVEDPEQVEEYQPLPVYPIVEPEIPEEI